AGTVKHGSLIALPTVHRHAPDRVTAIDSVQHEPSRTSPLGTAGMNRITLVCATIKGLTGTCAPTSAGKKVIMKASDVMTISRILILLSENGQLDSRRNHRAARNAHQRL